MNFEENCPFNTESLAQLKAFVDFCNTNPNVLYIPELSFFKEYLESVGATLPKPKKMSTSTEGKQTPETFQESEEVSSDQESELEFDLTGCVEPDAENPDQEMGNPDKELTEEDSDKADEKRVEGMSRFSEGDFEKAVQLFTEAIVLNPTSALLFAKRGQAFIKLNKPNACIKDCTYALELNCDSATAYKFRGRAHLLLAEWEKAARDLREAGNIDYDEQIDEWLKEVTPNAKKIEQHRLKRERKQKDKDEKDKAERVRKAREAHAKAAEQKNDQPNVGEGSPGVEAGLGDFYKLLQDPDVMTAFQDPEVSAAFQDISMNPGNFAKYQSNAKVMALMAKLSSKFQGSFPGFPGAGGFPSFPGTGGFKGNGGGPNTATDDDGLD